MSSYGCGNCEWYVRRPYFCVAGRCVYDGVCLLAGKAADSSHEGVRCVCNSVCRLDGKPARWRERKAKTLLGRKAERLRELVDTMLYARELTDEEAHELRDVTIEIARFING